MPPGDPGGPRPTARATRPRRDARARGRAGAGRSGDRGATRAGRYPARPAGSGGAPVSGRPLSSWIAEQPFGTTAHCGAPVRIDASSEHPIRSNRGPGGPDGGAGLGGGGRPPAAREGSTPALPAFQAIGYRQLVRHLEGEWSLEHAIDDTVKATRRFAKRQETWFRREPEVTWFSAQDLDRRISHILEHVKHSGPGRAYG